MAWEDRPYYRDDQPPGVRWAVPMPSPLTIGIMAACLLVFLVVNVFGARSIFFWGELTFLGHGLGSGWTQPWRWLTYAYLHGSGSHIFWNLLGLYFFLPPLERVWGPKRAFGFYTLGTIAAGFAFWVMCLFYPFPGLVGASGGIFAALGACAYLFPEISFFGIIPIRIAAALYGVFFLLSISGDKDPADAAHLAGLIFGFFAPYYGRHAFSGLSRRWEQRRREAAVKAEQYDQSEIDRILQKVHDSGMNSLSRGEKATLKRATERQRRADLARAARR